MDRIERIERATAFASSKVNGVSAADLSKPTPCSDFDVHALLNHMVGGLAMMATAAQGDNAPMPDGDQFGSDPGAAYDQRRDALTTALRRDGVLDRDWKMPFGAMPGATMANIAFMENLTHAWDLAQATGQDSTMPEDLVRECLDVVVTMETMLRLPRVCGPAIAVPDDASPQDQLVAFLGRHP